jgi:hypothetical protein
MQQDVLGLDVPVNHVVTVGVVQRARHLGGDPHRVGDRELLLAGQAVPQRLPLDERHDIEEDLTPCPPLPSVERGNDEMTRVEQRQDVRVLQVRGGLDLGEEPLAADFTAASSGLSTLTATRRSCLRSWAR